MTKMRVVFNEKYSFSGKTPIAISAINTQFLQRRLLFISVTRVPRLNQDAKGQVFPVYHKKKSC